MDRTAFLDRARLRLKDANGPALIQSFPPTPASGTDASPERFLTALRLVNGDGSVVPRAALRDAIATALSAGDGARAEDRKRTAVVSPDASAYADDVDAALSVAGFDVVRPSTGAGWRDEGARAAVGVTSAILGVASTGSVLIGSGASSPRAASILPETHLVILPADRLVAGLEDALEAVQGLASTHSAPFLVTGPSRTSDIEMEMVLGAHGPRRLHVLLVE
jgi:hypothetical protein